MTTSPSRTAAAARRPAPAHRPLGVSSILLILLTAVLWGGTPVAISYSVDRLPPVAVAGIRFALAAVFMLFWCRFEGAGLALKRGQFRAALIAGFLLFLQISCFNLGIQESNSSHATLFINTFIFWVAGIEHFVTRAYRLSGRKLLGLLLAAAGVVVILSLGSSPREMGAAATIANGAAAAAMTRDTPTLRGDLFLLSSGALLGIKIIYTKHALSDIEPGKFIFWHDLIGVAFFALYSGLFETISWEAVQEMPVALGLLYQGVLVAGLCFALQAWLLKRHAASQISVFSFATPLFGIVLAVLFRGDPLSPWLFVSGLCVVAGILLVNSNSGG